jgi:DamX protein
MDTELLAALDDDVYINDRPVEIAPFSPPSLSSSQLKQLELLQHLSLYSELLILVCAEKGMGKTFIAKGLLACRENPDQSLMIDADFSISYVDVLHNLAQFLDLAELADDIDGIEQQILSHCVLVSEEEQGSVLLIIDQADQLSDEVLEDINQLALLAPNALHIMLLATSGFENKLLLLTEPQAPLHIMEVEMFSDDEAEILLLENFPGQEWSGEQVDYILQQSSGNPGKILYLAQKIVAGVKPSTKPAVTAPFPITHIAALMLVASAFMVAHLYQADSPAEIESVEDISAQVVEIDVSEKIDTSDKIERSVVALTEDEAAEIDFNFVEIKEAQVANIESLVADTLVIDQLQIDAQPDEIPVEAKNTLYSPSEHSLLAADKRAFVIQVFASYSSKSADVFIASNKTTVAQLKSYETSYKGKPWYVVISGPFDNRLAANQQAKTLPKKLLKQKPWVRSVEPIQQLLKTRI